MSRGSIYEKPSRVYLILGLLALVGLYSGLKLPISLFPNSAQPFVHVTVGYGNQTATEFMENYGKNFEGTLYAINTKEAEVASLNASYDHGQANYDITFSWKSTPSEAKREVESALTNLKSQLSEEARNGTYLWENNGNSGFFAASFYSDHRSLDEVYDLVESTLKAGLASVKDASDPTVWRPARPEVQIELKAEAMAQFQLLPRDVEAAVKGALASYRGGSINIGPQTLQVEMPRAIENLEQLAAIPLLTPSGQVLHLNDIARIDLSAGGNSGRLFKTSGAPSIIVFSNPKSGGNIKRMSEDILELLRKSEKVLPPDIHYKVLVDPSAFIRSAVNNVFHEVLLGSMLAVLILFFFIGSFKNVVTTALEIPLSILLAFILMKFFGVNINLISLGGLALSAGMNVDGSVVVMENIFRHFGESTQTHWTLRERLAVVVRAVSEVKRPLILSTLASLVVFVPLIFTSDLSSAILGDLAKAVVFSHGLSAIVALILVPTVRLHLMRNETTTQHHTPLLESFLVKLEQFYARCLHVFIQKRALKYSFYSGLIVLLALLVLVVAPRLPREVMGTPDSDMIYLFMNTKENSRVQQMETQAGEVERELLEKFGASIDYTFTQIHSNSASILAHLKNKRDMEVLWKGVEKHFVNTPLLNFQIGPWNPSELPIPDPPDFRVAIRGGDLKSRRDAALELKDLLEGKQLFSRVYATARLEQSKGVVFYPNREQWSDLLKSGQRISPGDLVSISQIATDGKRIDQMNLRNHDTPIYMHYPKDLLDTPEELAAFPIGIANKIVPFKALLPYRIEERLPSVVRENLQDVFAIEASQSKMEKSKLQASKKEAELLVQDWLNTRQSQDLQNAQNPVITIEDAGKDVTKAIEQLCGAIIASIVLMLFLLLFEFGSLVEALLVLVAVPLGFIGAIAALYLAGSTLSLNSALGIILLNGIAVNNSIIMVDFIRRLHAAGHTPLESAILAAQKRLRPILITSLTTILGMLPIAFGFGEGGKILQPLGIAVSGGLWISMAFTLFLVPALQVAYLKRSQTH